jgi:hypothetical protein
MVSLQISHLQLNSSGLNSPIPDIGDPAMTVAVEGRLNDLGLRGRYVGLSVPSWAIGRSLWLHDLPWFTQLLQNPQSPSLQTSQRQKHSLAQAKHREQNVPVSSLNLGSSLVNVFLPSELIVVDAGRK